eukprot:2220173-Ditylum_brightwellii.AAC.1
MSSKCNTIEDKKGKSQLADIHNKFVKYPDSEMSFEVFRNLLDYQLSLIGCKTIQLLNLDLSKSKGIDDYIIVSCIQDTQSLPKEYTKVDNYIFHSYVDYATADYEVGNGIVVF